MAGTRIVLNFVVVQQLGNCYGRSSGARPVLCCVGDVRLHVCVCAGEGGVLTAAVTGQNSGKDHTGVRDNHTLAVPLQRQINSQTSFVCPTAANLSQLSRVSARATAQARSTHCLTSWCFRPRKTALSCRLSDQQEHGRACALLGHFSSQHPARFSRPSE